MEFLILSDYTILNSQMFHTHIVGKITMHVSDLENLIHKLNETGYLFSNSDPRWRSRK